MQVANGRSTPPAQQETIVVPKFFMKRSSGLSGSGYGMRYEATSPTGDGKEEVQEAQQATEQQEETERRVDLLLLLAKCSVPALFVAVGGAVAIPGDAFLTDGMRRATEEMAGGALIVTYAFEVRASERASSCYFLHARVARALRCCARMAHHPR